MTKPQLDRWTCAQRVIKSAKQQIKFPSWLDPEDIEHEMICIALECIDGKSDIPIKTQRVTRTVVSKMKAWVASCERERHLHMSSQEIAQYWYDSTVDSMANQYITDTIYERLMILSKRKYDVMYMSLFEGMTQSQISEKLGMCPQYAREMMQQSIRYLRYPPRARLLKACVMYYDGDTNIEDLVDSFASILNNTTTV